MCDTVPFIHSFILIIPPCPYYFALITCRCLKHVIGVIQMAEHANRTFLLRWSQKAPLEEWLEPSAIDWRVKDVYHVRSSVMMMSP